VEEYEAHSLAENLGDEKRINRPQMQTGRNVAFIERGGLSLFIFDRLSLMILFIIF
jgi:hypothetical protein